MANHQSHPVPAQTFYVPFPETNLLYDTFLKIVPFADGPIHSLVSISISTEDTVIWIDHAEDGYKDDVTHPHQDTTVIWGDHNATNGCAPNLFDCTDANDYFRAGDSIVLDNQVDINTQNTDITFGGGDKIQASFPVAVTRRSFPDHPGAFMAAAVEVLDTTFWGTEYEAPLSQSSPSDTTAFEYAGAYIQAATDNTTVTYPNGTIGVLNRVKLALQTSP